MAVISGALTANGNTAEIKIELQPSVSPGFHVHYEITSGAGVLSLEFLGDDDSFHPIEGAAFSSNVDKLVVQPKGRTIRGVVTGAASLVAYFEIADFIE